MVEEEQKKIPPGKEHEEEKYSVIKDDKMLKPFEKDIDLRVGKFQE